MTIKMSHLSKKTNKQKLPLQKNKNLYEDKETLIRITKEKELLTHELEYREALEKLQARYEQMTLALKNQRNTLMNKLQCVFQFQIKAIRTNADNVPVIKFDVDGLGLNFMSERQIDNDREKNANIIHNSSLGSLELKFEPRAVTERLNILQKKMYDKDVQTDFEVPNYKNLENLEKKQSSVTKNSGFLTEEKSCQVEMTPIIRKESSQSPIKSNSQSEITDSRDDESNHSESCDSENIGEYIRTKINSHVKDFDHKIFSIADNANKINEHFEILSAHYHKNFKIEDQPSKLDCLEKEENKNDSELSGSDLSMFATASEKSCQDTRPVSFTKEESREEESRSEEIVADRVESACSSENESKNSTASKSSLTKKSDMLSASSRSSSDSSNSNKTDDSAMNVDRNKGINMLKQNQKLVDECTEIRKNICFERKKLKGLASDTSSFTIESDDIISISSDSESEGKKSNRSTKSLIIKLSTTTEASTIECPSQKTIPASVIEISDDLTFIENIGHLGIILIFLFFRCLSL